MRNFLLGLLTSAVVMLSYVNFCPHYHKNKPDIVNKCPCKCGCASGKDCSCDKCPCKCGCADGKECTCEKGCHGGCCPLPKK